MKEYDEDAAVAFMRAALPDDKRNAYSDDDILGVNDLIFDYYEQNGLLDPSLEDDGEEEDLKAEMAAVSEYVCNILRKDRDNIIDLADVPLLVAAEYEYEESLLD